MKNQSNFMKSLSKNGFYIILFLCITAVGVAGYVMFQPHENTNEYASNENMTQTDGGYDFESAVKNTPIDIPQTPPTVTTQPKATTDTAKQAPKASATPSTKKKTTSTATAKSTMAEATPNSFVSAVSGKVEIPFSGDDLVKSATFEDWRTHSGIDISAQQGTKVCSIASGVVKKVYEDEMMGYTVVISHSGGIQSTYSNLIKGVVVKVGQKINAGDVIGGVGNSAVAECMQSPHLHLEVTKNGTLIDPLSILK